MLLAVAREDGCGSASAAKQSTTSSSTRPATGRVCAWMCAIVSQAGDSKQVGMQQLWRTISYEGPMISS